jgi:DNA-binding winged helix-turn-helix (wHTH) protein
MQLRFADCVIDTDRRQVFRSGQEVTLSPKAYQLLTLLVDARPKAVAKEQLSEALWPDTYVVEANLANLIGEIRAALGDRAQAPRFIRTLHGFGYAFSADAQIVNAAEEELTGRAACWLVWKGQALPLLPGENVIGRDSAAQVRLDAPGVSRRHARIVVRPDGAAIEDLHSKNGTRVAGARIDAPRELSNHEEVVVGSVRLTFHRASPGAATETVAD